MFLYLSGNDGGPDLTSQNDWEPVDEDESGDDGQEDHPEPEEDVDLLIDDVQGKHTQAVLFLNSSRRTILVESALGHLKRKSS